MVEPPTVGYTGVVWDARPADRLAKDLTTGPGSEPMARAGQAWAGLATGLGEAIIEYESILGVIDQAWKSGQTDEARARMTAMRDWLAGLALAAAANAAKAEVQVAAFEIAKLAMPNAEEIAATKAMQASLAQGLALGGPLAAAADKLDHEIDVAKNTASRVMQTYEAATAPLAQPWRQPQPPKVSGTVTAARAVATAENQQLIGGMGTEFALLQQLRSQPGAYVAETLVTTEEPVVEAVETVTVDPVAVPQAPIAPLSAAGVADEHQDHGPSVVHRAGAAPADPDAPDRLGLDVGYGTAPAVLGGPTAAKVAMPRATMPVTGGEA